jgi:hypothetical protein
MRANQIFEAGGLCIPAWNFRWAAYFVLVCLLIQTAFSATLTHRYSFVTDAGDSVGSANGVLQGNAYVTNGALVLDGTNSSVQLPNDLFTNYDSISFEVWYVDGAVSSPSNQLYNFSGPAGGMNYMLFGQGDFFVGGSQNIVSLPSPAVGGTNHLVWTQDSLSQTAQIYINGLLAASAIGFTNTPAMIGSTTNNLIGAGATNVAYSNFKGSILEFRTYQGALSPLDVAVADALGSDQPQLNPGALQDIRVMTPPPTGPGALFRIGVYADFANVTNVNISTQPDLILSSDNTNVIVVAPDQRLQTVGLGVADIAAGYEGFSNTLAVTVGVPQDVALIHRYSFNEQTNDWIVHDAVGGANGELLNVAIVHSAPFRTNVTAVFTGKGQLVLYGSPGSVGGSASPGGYAALPPGLISCLSEMTMEAWITWTPGYLPLIYGDGAWQRIFDFGSSEANYLFLTPATDNASFTTNSVIDAAITTNGNFNETPRLTWTNKLPTNVETCVTVTYSPARGVMKVYLNGTVILSGTAVIPLSAIIDINNWLGKSEFPSDAYFYGSYDEFRIYRGLLSDADVAADYTAGPDTVGVDFVLHDFPSTNSLSITWGTTATNWFLESSPVLGASAVWTPVSATPMLQNGRWQVNVPISGDASYFRLHAPP